MKPRLPEPALAGRAVLAWPPPRLLLVVAAAILSLALVAVGVWIWTARQERQITAAYAQALTALADADASEARAQAAQTIEALLTRYPSARLAQLAAYELGHVRYAERDWGRARAAYELAIAGASSPTLRTLARAGIGYTWEAERNWTRAAESFQAALAELKPGDFHYAELLLALGRTQLQAGKTAEAIETYRAFLKEFPSAARADDVRARLARLGAAP